MIGNECGGGGGGGGGRGEGSSLHIQEEKNLLA